MATAVWDRIRAGVGVASSTRDEGLRGVALRLAAQTVGLLLVMLLILEIVVYVITQQALLGSLKTTLQQRANQWDGTVCHILPLSSCPPGFRGPGAGGQPGAGNGNPGGGGGNGFGPPPPAPANADTPSEASIVYVNTELRIIHADGALGWVLLDSQAARQALRSHSAQWANVSYKGQDYLVYTKPLWATNDKVVAVAQASISEHQYEGTMGALLQALVVVALLGLGFSSGISVVLVRRALQPIRLAIQRQRDFVADAAHELRTPLAIMRTVGEVGLNEASPDEQQATIEQMLAENRHLTRLVDDLSLLARTDTNTVAINRAPVDLSLLVTDTVAELAPLAEAQDVQLNAEVESGIQVTGDLLRLRQLLLILLDNALKHTPADGQVEVKVYSLDGRAQIQVADTGQGIDPADLPHIFDRFYRADKARTSEGSGLGLAIGKWIVEAHGGQIQAGNRSERGAVFTVTLPLLRGAARSQ